MTQCFKVVSMVLQGHFKGQSCFNCLMGYSWVFKECYGVVSKVFQRCFNADSRLFTGCLKGVSRVFVGCLLSWTVFMAAT